MVPISSPRLGELGLTSFSRLITLPKPSYKPSSVSLHPQARYEPRAPTTVNFIFVRRRYAKTEMRKLIQTPCAPSRAAHFAVNGGRSRSVCTFCRSSQLAKVLSNGLVLSTTSNAFTTRPHSIHCRAATQFHSTKKCDCASRSFSTGSSPLISSSSTFPLTIRPAHALVACLTPSEVPQLSEEWFALRKDKLTASSFSTALGFWKGKRRSELWREKVFPSDTIDLPESSKKAMEWGVLNEAEAVARYKSITGREVGSYGFAVHRNEQFSWIGASPDGLLSCYLGDGILEVKCPYNKGKPETALPWSTLPFYYMPQVQGQMEIMNREWVDLYCWTPNASSIFRIYRERSYWTIISGILKEFWWENVVPARQALLLGKEEVANSYEPSSTHKLTGLAIAKSISLASESKLLCKEISGHLEFFR